MTVELRPERAADRQQIRRVHLAAFGDHGATVAELVESLRELISGGRGVSIVAERAGQVVGHVMLVPVLLDAPRELVPVLVLSPLGVLPEHQRSGVGSALVRAGVQQVAGLGAPAVFLEGDPGYYSRLGFVAAGPVGFRKPSLRIPDPAFQVLTLPGYRSWMTGTLVYPQAFWQHDAVGLRE